MQIIEYFKVTKEKIHEAAPFIWQIVGPCLLIGRLLVRGEVLFWGTSYLQFSGWRWTAWQMIREGIFPSWNPLNGMGAPLFANYQAAFLYPPNILVWLGALLNGIGH